MALINCPFCNQIVSEKADKCVHCGSSLKNLIICKECGSELKHGMPYCSVCGCPVEETEQIINDAKEHANDIKPKKRKKKRTILTIVAVLLIGVIACGLITMNEESQEYNYYSDLSNEESQEYSYYSDLFDMTYTMISSSASAEECGNLIITVWYNSIFGLYDEESDAYTIENGRFVSDFNDALENLYESETFKIKMNSITENRALVMEYMLELNNPPERYKIAYEQLSDTYDTYMEFTNLVVSPIGSYNSYSEDFNELDIELAKELNELQVYLDY